MQPGETITPDGKKQPAPEGEMSVSHESKQPDAKKPEEEPKPSPKDESVGEQAEPVPQPTETAAETEASWQYSGADQDAEAYASQTSLPSVEPVTWSASEFVDHEKNVGWFLALAAITAVALGIIYLLTQDIVTVVVVGMAAILFGVTAKRKPRTLQYLLDEHGIQIGDKAYSYQVFKSFSLIEEGAFNSIQLMPLKRFMPPISLYYPPENEQLIFSTLGNYIPHEERMHDPVERLMKRIRF